MQRNKARGRPRVDISKQLEEEPGRRLKVSSKHLASLLKSRNYENFNDDGDSVDMEDILYGQINKNESFDPFALRHLRMTQDTKLHSHNYSTQEDSQQANTQERNLFPVDKMIETKQQAREKGQAQNHLLNHTQTQLKVQMFLGSQQVNHPIKETFVAQVKIQKSNSFDVKNEILSDEGQQDDSQLKRQSEEVSFRKKVAPRIGEFSKSTIDSIIVYLTASKGNLSRSSLKELSEHFQLPERDLLRIQNDWRFDPQLKKYARKSEEPLGALIDGKRERTIERIKIITQLLQENPYLTQREICDKLVERNSPKKILLSAIIRLMRIAGFKKKRIPTQFNEKAKLNARTLRKQFLTSYKKLQEEKATKFYYLGEFLFHKYLYNDTYWTLKDKSQIPKQSESLVAQGIIMIAFLTSQGNLLWQAREGNYKREEYIKVITKMMKKCCKTVHDVAIINETPLRDIALAKEVTSKLGCTLLKFPYKSEMMGPLELFFMDMKQKVKKVYLQSPDEAMSKLCECVSSIEKSQLINFIQKSKKDMQSIQK